MLDLKGIDLPEKLERNRNVGNSEIMDMTQDGLDFLGKRNVVLPRRIIQQWLLDRHLQKRLTNL